jgi:tetratricopeptide (TPR) repeat protein
MKFNYQLLSILTGVSIALVQVESTSAQNSVEVGKIAKGITVLIHSKSSNSQGSGVIIQKDRQKNGNTYTILTAGHVVDGNDKYEIQTLDGQRYPLKDSRIRKLKNIDLAVVTFASDIDYDIAKLGDSSQIAEGQTSFVAGFADDIPVNNNSVYSFIEGKIIANASSAVLDGYGLIYNNPTSQGMSGGPVLNEKGEVIAIHGKGDYTAPEASSNNPSISKIKSYRSFAIPINTFLQSSSNLGVRIASSTPINLKISSTKEPKSDDLYVKGLNKYRQANYQGAIQDFSAAIEINPKASQALFDRGNAYYAMSNYQQAVADYSQVLQINSRFVDALLARGNAYYGLGDTQAALNDYQQVIALDKNNADAYNNRGRISMEQGKLQAAIADFNQSIQLNPKFAGAYNNRGNARRLLGDLHEVVADFNRALAINPKYAEAYYNRGLVRYSAGDNQGALKDYDDSLRFDPSFAPAYISRGNIRNEFGDKQGAIADYTKSIDLNPKSSLAYVSRGNARNDLGDRKGAIEDYTQGINLDTKFASAYEKRGTVRALAGDKQGALADLQQAADLFNQQGNREFYQRTLEKIRLIERYN